MFIFTQTLLGYFIGVVLSIIIISLISFVIYLCFWFSQVNEMKKEYIDKKNKKLYNQIRK